MKLRNATPLISALLLVGCSFSVGSNGDPEEPAAEVAELASNALGEEIGRTPDTFDCGDGTLEIAEGNVFDCTLTDQGTTYEATVTVTEVDGSDYKISVQVADQPTEQAE